MTIKIQLAKIQQMAESRKMSAEEVLSEIDVAPAEYIEIEDVEQLKRLARELIMPMSEVLKGADSDLVKGVKISRGDEGFHKVCDRGTGKYYTYQHLATSSSAPELMALKVSLHCNSAENIVLNGGHASRELVFVLKGTVRVDWAHGQGSLTEVLGVGDSIYVSPNVPHSFIAIEEGSEILAFNYIMP